MHFLLRVVYIKGPSGPLSFRKGPFGPLYNAKIITVLVVTLHLVINPEKQRQFWSSAVKPIFLKVHREHVTVAGWKCLVLQCQVFANFLKSLESFQEFSVSRTKCGTHSSQPVIDMMAIQLGESSQDVANPMLILEYGNIMADESGFRDCMT